MALQSSMVSWRREINGWSWRVFLRWTWGKRAYRFRSLLLTLLSRLITSTSACCICFSSFGLFVSSAMAHLIAEAAVFMPLNITSCFIQWLVSILDACHQDLILLVDITSYSTKTLVLSMNAISLEGNITK